MSRESRRRVLTAEERVLWGAFTKQIAPLRESADPSSPEPEHEMPVARAPRPMSRVERPAATPAVPTPPPIAPLGRRMRQRVARGKAEIDARLDLHGLTQSEAHAALLHFLRNASARGARLVLVITGKGGRWQGDAERGVLRRQLPHWLALPEFRAFVIGYEQAHIAHGGDGAWYVSIRRSRAQD
jgi:DNA-nicking Smr family endonuclease